jgi:hypothetical protein
MAEHITNLQKEQAEYKASVREAFEMANHIYDADESNVGDILPGNWELSEIITDGGMKMGVYKRIDPKTGEMEYALVNKGTTTWDNMKDNLAQPSGNSQDMVASIEAAQRFVAEHEGSKVTMIGHSKGGGEATANAVATGSDAIVFNPAYVNLDAYEETRGKEYTGNATAYVVEGEMLDTVNNVITIPYSAVNNVITRPYSERIHNAGDLPYDIVYLPQQHGGDWCDVLTPQPIQGWHSFQNHGRSAIDSALDEAGYIAI